MRELPIPFNTEMVRAILAGRKTVTRRPIKPQPAPDTESVGLIVAANNDSEVGRWRPYRVSRGFPEPTGAAVRSPFGAPGDVLYVREAWAGGQHGTSVQYRADWQANDFMRWRPSIHMPKWASRIRLPVTRVWVERVQDITEEGARTEGVRETHLPLSKCHVYHVEDYPTPRVYDSARACFRARWDAIYAAKGLGWDHNPWVWCAEWDRAEVRP